MADLNDGSTDYPSTLDSNTTEPTGDPTDPTPIEGAKLACVAIETELGVDPAGSLVDVKTFLQTEHRTDGKHVLKISHMFMMDDVDAGHDETALVLSGATAIKVEAPWAGSVVGISVLSNSPRTAGSLTVCATVNGVATGLEAVLDATNPDHHSAVQDIALDAFSAGDRLGAAITTTGDWLPDGSADIVVVTYVSFN